MMKMIAVAPSPHGAAPSPPAPDSAVLRAVAGEVVRDMIRRDPALWARVQADPALRREFGFDDEPEDA